MIEGSGSDAAQPLGELLLGRGLLSEEKLASALAEQQRSARPLGEILVGLGYISAPDMALALATQRGGVTKSEYGYAVGFEAPGHVTAAQLVPPPVTPGAAPVLGRSPAAIQAVPAPVATEPADDSRQRELAAAVAARDALAGELHAVQQELEDVRVQVALREEETAASVRAETDGLRAQLAELRGIADAVAAAEARAAELERAARDADARSAEVAGQLQALIAERDELRGSAAAGAEAEARAVELERTAREAAEQIQALTAERDAHGRLDGRLATVESQLEHAAAPAAQPYEIFATLVGKYEIVERVGVVPGIGDEIEVDGTTHAVVRVGGSALAGSDAACVYTIPAA